MSTTATTRTTYGNWHEPRSPGLGKLGSIASAILVLGALAASLVWLIGSWIGGLVILAATLAVVVVTGTPFGDAMVRRIGFNRQVRRRTHQGRSGVFSRSRTPHVRLPGMLGRLTLLDGRDPYGNDFAVIKNPRRGGLYTLVVRCDAEGPSGHDQDRINQWVNGFAHMLTSMAHENALVGAKVIGETAPDPGGRLESHVHGARSEDSPPVARQTIDAVVRNAAVTASENVTYIETTFAGRSLSRRGKEEEILGALARKVPNLLTQTQIAGGGSVEMMTADDLTRVIRTAYDPAAALHYDALEAADEPNPVTWEEAGPVADQSSWSQYRHDSGLSVTWEMVRPPQAAVVETALRTLLRPERELSRKRVALIYRPHAPEQSTTIAENDARTAVQATGGKRRPAAEVTVRQAAVEQARNEVAQTGAALIRFSLMVTATVQEDEDLERAVSVVEARAGSVPLRLRRSYGSQAAAFATTLPVGFLPWEHSIVPKELREWI